MGAWHLDHFEAFLFDMDGVLTDSMPNHYEAWRQTFASFGVSVSWEEVLRREGEQGMVTLETVLTGHGHPVEPEELPSILEKKEAIFRSLPRPSLFEGAEELVVALHQKGKRLALVTGTSLAEARDNVPPSLFRCFHAVVSGDQVRQGKPAPEPYLLALEKLNVSRHVSLVIENAPYGIRSAKRAGLRCIALTTSLPASELAEADGIVTDMVELRNLLFC